MKKLHAVVVAAATLALAAGLLWAQGAKQTTNLNDMPYAKVKAMLSNPHQAAELKAMVKKDHVILMGGHPINGKLVTMKGELTGADCFLSVGVHGREHALCSKACVAHGSPILFLARDGATYLVLTPRDGVPLPGKVLNALGTPNVTITAHMVDSHGMKALSVQSIRM